MNTPPPQTDGTAPHPGAVLGLGGVLTAAWGLYAVLGTPWLVDQPPALEALIDQTCQLFILGLLPVLWVWCLDRQTQWVDVLYPFGVDWPRRWGRVWAVVGLYSALTLWLALLRHPEGMLASPLTSLSGALLGPHHGITPIALIGIKLAAGAVLEETLFRGYFYGRLSACYGRRWGMLGQAMLFTLLHAAGWVGTGAIAPPMIALYCLETFAFGLVAGAVVRWQGGLGAAMLLHWLVNLIHAAS